MLLCGQRFIRPGLQINVIRKLMLCAEEFDLRETSDWQDNDVARSYLSSRICWIGSTA